MRAILIIATLVCSGCRSAEFAVNHQMTGLHVVAKFEAKDSVIVKSHDVEATRVAVNDLELSSQYLR